MENRVTAQKTAPTFDASNPLLVQFLEEPALIAEDAQHTFTTYLALGYQTLSAEMRRNDGQIVLGDAAGDEDFWNEESWQAKFRPYVVRDGILRVPVQGVMLNKFPYQLGAWATGYEYIQAAIERGLGDAEVKGIALDVDSPGGSASGCFELSDFIAAANKVKPIHAFVDDSAYSAAYALSSGAGEISATKGSGVGSIGVVTMHADYSGFLDAAGIKVTFIFAGRHKVDGNPYEPLTDSAKNRIQKRIDALYSDFVSLVARNRGLDEKAVRDTEALTYPAPDGLNLGLIDQIMPTKEAMQKFSSKMNDNQGDYYMSDNEKKFTAEEQSKAVETARAEGVAEGVAEGTKAGATAERARISAIVNHAEAKGREAAAQSMALDTDLSADQAGAVLAKLPATATESKATVKTEKSPFVAAMDTSDNPNLGTVSEDKVKAEEDDASARIVKAFKGE